MRTLSCACFTGVIATALAVLPTAWLQASPITLYDGTLQAVTPNNFNPAWLSFVSLGGSQSYVGGVSATNYNSAASNAIQGGYSNYLGLALVNSQFPLLDRTTGFRLSFTVEVVSEGHVSSERAGFSVIAVAGDVAPGVAAGIEIGFQANRVFAQNDNPLFGSPAAESSTFNPVGVGFVDYDLTVLNSSYTLTANGQSILTGGLKDYTPFAGFPDVYEIPNFIFLGDNTTSAGASIHLRSASIGSLTALPEPSSVVLMALALTALGARGVRRRSGTAGP